MYVWWSPAGIWEGHGSTRGRCVASSSVPAWDQPRTAHGATSDDVFGLCQSHPLLCSEGQLLCGSASGVWTLSRSHGPHPQLAELCICLKEKFRIVSAGSVAWNLLQDHSQWVSGIPFFTVCHSLLDTYACKALSIWLLLSLRIETGDKRVMMGFTICKLGIL